MFERLSGAEPLRLPGQCRYAKTGHERPDARLAKEKTAVATGWKLTLPCTRDEAEAIGELDVETLGLDPPPTPMTREPDESRPDEWLLLEAYLRANRRRCGGTDRRFSGAGAPHNLEPLGDEDWVTMSQAGLGARHRRALLRQNLVRPCRLPPGSTPFIIDAGRAFGTGHHETTSGTGDDRPDRGRSHSRLAGRFRHWNRTARLCRPCALARGLCAGDGH